MSNSAAKSNALASSGGQDNLRAAYSEICIRYRAIDDFRAKLLGLLPLASGAGISLLLAKALAEESVHVRLLPPIGVFGSAVTLGLYFYELRGIQYCIHLIAAGRALEEQLKIPGAFSTRPKQHVGGRISEISAAHLIYGAVLAAWIFVAAIFAFPDAVTERTPAILRASLLALTAVIVVVGVARRFNLRPDEVRITWIAPCEPVGCGVPAEFTIKVDATLQSAKKGTAQISFNLNSPDSFDIAGSCDLRFGQQQITFKVSVTPVDWRECGDFAVVVDIGPKPAKKAFKATASVRKGISFKV